MIKNNFLPSILTEYTDNQSCLNFCNYLIKNIFAHLKKGALLRDKKDFTVHQVQTDDTAVHLPIHNQQAARLNHY